MQLVFLQSLQSILIPIVIFKVLEKVLLIFEANLGSLFEIEVLRYCQFHVQAGYCK